MIKRKRYIGKLYRSKEVIK